MEYGGELITNSEMRVNYEKKEMYDFVRDTAVIYEAYEGGLVTKKI